MEDELDRLAVALAERLIARRQTLATAESCTGGWVAKVLTDSAGSSGWFERGFVTYSNQAKQEMLGVGGDTLDRHGAVSEQVVREMATGALRHSRADRSVAISGIAGPGGGIPGKPVGTVWFGWAERNGKVWTRRVRFAGDRQAVRRQAVMLALQELFDALA